MRASSILGAYRHLALCLAASSVALASSACGGSPETPDAAPPPDGGRDGGVDAGDPPLVPDLYCPGSPGCPDEGDGSLWAGAAAVPITPSLDDVEPLTVDVNGNGLFDPLDGDVFQDLDGDGLWDAIWLAGFGNGRAATGIHDEVWARALALRRNETTVVMVSLDAVGWFLDDTDDIRALVADLDVDYVMVAATHCHETRDTIGIWGRTLDETGRDEGYMRFVKERAAQSIREAVAALRPAHVQYASLRLRDQPGGMLRYVSDSRDPLVIDDEVRIMRFVESRDPSATISTFVSFTAHPEYMGSRNTLLSSDFPNWLRDGIEEGVEGPDGERIEGVGGVTVYLNGALGSQIGPGRVTLQTWQGDPVSRYTLEAAATVGTQVAYFVLRALGEGGGSVTEESADLAFRRHRFFMKIQNTRYHIAFRQGLFVREVYNWDPSRPIRQGRNEPDVITEIAVLDVGRAQLLTVPGELDPVLFVGGYDGSYTPDGLPVVDTTRTNAPELARAPAPPYLRDRAREDADQVWLLGLTNDFLGYFIPEFDYALGEVPYLVEAPGAHYEETNSIGIDGWPRLHGKLQELLAWRP